MAYSEAQKRAVKKYNEKAYDEIKIRVKKGNKEIIQQYAASKNEKVNQMINRLLQEEIPELKKVNTVPSIQIKQYYLKIFGRKSDIVIILYPVYTILKKSTTADFKGECTI